MRTIIVIPTYNEVENLPVITSRLFALDLQDLEILIVDDASPDGTGMVAEHLAQEHPGRVHVLHRQGKGGLGTAYLDGFRWALKDGADAIIQMDADLSHSPDDIPRLLQQLSQADVVIGSRYIPGGQLDRRWGLGRRLLSWWANSVWVRTILGFKIKDGTGGFKCWRRSALERIRLDRIRSNGYIFQVEMNYAAERAGLRICEVPICFEDRQFGNSKMSWKVNAEAALRVFEIRWRYGLGSGKKILPTLFPHRTPRTSRPH